MTYIKNYFSDFELETLHSEVINNKRELTEEELDTLLAMFWERHGTNMYHMNLNPLFVRESYLKNQEAEKKDRAEAIEWLEKENLEVFDGVTHEPKDLSMDFLCKDPSECVSHQNSPSACSCIRDNFKSPTQFRVWVDKQITELATELTEDFPFHDS